MGGQRALEWAVTEPHRVQRVAAIATGAAATSEQIAWAHTQLAAIRADPKFRGGDYYQAAAGAGPHAGLGIARQIAHTTYRSAAELEGRFARDPQAGEDPLRGGRFAVQSYLDHHGTKLARRFDANSYLVLTETMMTHDLGRGRGGLNSALAQITAQVLAVGVSSDRLFLPAQAEQIATGTRRGIFRLVKSPYGHDGFLIELEQLGPLVKDFLAA